MKEEENEASFSLVGNKLFSCFFSGLGGVYAPFARGIHLC